MLDDDNPFWRFSLAVYAAPGVAAECLSLQSALNIDVNVLLYVAWLGNAHHVKLTDDAMTAIEARVQTWRDTVVRPLRAIRQDLKTMPAIVHSVVTDLRSEIARVELRAEQIEQAVLFDTSAERIDGMTEGTAEAPAAQAVPHNVNALLRRSIPNDDQDGSEAAKASCLITEAIAYQCATDESSQ
jgi:uncharacterized protein (TIGR02444 family)